MIASVQTHHRTELLVSGLEAAELDELREWFCYTKPMGPSIKIIATPASAGRAGFCMVATGTEPGFRSGERFCPVKGFRGAGGPVEQFD